VTSELRMGVPGELGKARRGGTVDVTVADFCREFTTTGLPDKLQSFELVDRDVQVPSSTWRSSRQDHLGSHAAAHVQKA
jgi:hypothetical protein